MPRHRMRLSRASLATPPLSTPGASSYALYFSLIHFRLASFVVLEHDLFQQTVDLAVGYFLDAALTHNPPFKVSHYLFRS